MSVLNLDKLLKPESVALIGASRRENAVGNVVMKNLLDADFQGPILPVNPRARTVRGVFAYADIQSLPITPDLAVICTPAHTVPEIITGLGEKGTRAAVVITAGLSGQANAGEFQQKILDSAKRFGLRILGPNCLGLLVPAIGLNASFAHTNSLRGRLALLSQSGALCTTILDWAKSRGIGFSHFVSVGDAIDVDFGDLLDYLGSDASTRGILMYVESISSARKFISAARATARNKSVVLIKSGRYYEAAKAAASHTGAIVGNDEVFDAAIRRAGMLRVYSIDDLFAAVETLAHARPVLGNRLAILTNGGGTGVLATDHLIASGGVLADLAPKTISGLNEVLPVIWSGANPVDIIGDSDAERYVAALRILYNDPNYDAILVMLVPSAVINNYLVAVAIKNEIESVQKPVLTCWMGEAAVEKSRRTFQRAGIPTYETPETAINAFMHMVDYIQNQKSLIETPPSVAADFEPQTVTAAQIITSILDQDRELMTEPEAKRLLQCYQVPIVDTRIVTTSSEAVNVADEIGFPVVLKVLSKDISHKSDLGGVLLNIQTSQLLEVAIEGIQAKIKRACPNATLDGFTVQKMVERRNAHELIIGVTTDAIFGPVILFGQGGTSVEIIDDKAVALPPLNMALAAQLINRTRISRILAGHRAMEAVARHEIELTLVKISQMISDHPEIVELDINPILADKHGVIALDARIRVQKTTYRGTERFSIRPYPKELEESLKINGKDLFIRPIRPEDEPAHQKFISNLSMEDLYFRFFRAVSNLSHEQLARFTQIDYDREMAFVAVIKNEAGETETLGVVRAVSDADNIEAEFAIIISTDFHRKGLGKILMQKMINYCTDRGTKRLIGQTLVANHGMQALARYLGFEIEPVVDEGVVNLKLDLIKAVS